MKLEAKIILTIALVLGAPMLCWAGAPHPQSRPDRAWRAYTRWPNPSGAPSAPSRGRAGPWIHIRH